MRRMTILTLLVAAAAIATTGCSQKYSAERDGKQLGEAVCDLRDADNQDEAGEAVQEINEQLDDLANKYAFYTAEDQADIQNNLADLAEHQIQGNDLLMQQDLTVLERSAGNIREDVNEVSQAAWDGMLQGLSECTQE